MTDHPTAALLNAFADGELSAEEAAGARQHVDECLSCAARLIDTWLLKTSIAKSGHRYTLPDEAQEQLRKTIHGEPRSHAALRSVSERAPRRWIGLSGWVAAAATLAVLLSWALVQFRTQRPGNSAIAAMAAEASDLHIAMLASGAPPQVVSSDRHTVKPWFQGKLPFSFNLPDALPADTRLEGANLAYLGDQPVAQLLFSLGRHHASVFVEQKKNADWPRSVTVSHAGFRVIAVEAGGLEFIAVSDADPAKILALATSLRDAQGSP